MAFVTAILVEVLVYTIPWLDLVLVIAIPAAIIAGMVVPASELFFENFFCMGNNVAV